jgi:enamine deaminase RidA (YjgF/YER057c/UK114 family)
MNDPITPSDIAPPAANYAHAVLSTGAARILHTSGVVPTRPDGSVPEEPSEQATVVWSSIAAILREASMEPNDIVSVVTYVVVGNDLRPIMAARDAFLGEHRAASTLVTVPALARPEWKMEIAVVAVA